MLSLIFQTDLDFIFFNKSKLQSFNKNPFRRLLKLLVLVFCVSGCGPKYGIKNLNHNYTPLSSSAIWATTAKKQEIRPGAFSGLYFLGVQKNGHLQFLTLPDRGPNTESLKIKGVHEAARPFLVPEFQLRWLTIDWDPKTEKLEIIKETLMRDSQNQPLTGINPYILDFKKIELGQKQPAQETLTAEKCSPVFAEEVPVDATGTPLAFNNLGFDPESIAQDESGNIWVGEEYRPGILKFTPDGQLISIYQPIDFIKNNCRSSNSLEKSILPPEYQFRKTNRGFEALTFAKGKIYAALQSPLDFPKNIIQPTYKNIVRILELDPISESITGEYLYPLEFEKVDKIGDIAYSVERDSFFIIEQNSLTGEKGTHLLREFKLDPEKNILTGKYFKSRVTPETQSSPLSKNETPDGFSKLSVQNFPEGLTRNDLINSKLMLNPKTVAHLNLSGIGFAEKMEGLALLPGNIWAVVNDNDFGIDGPYNLEQQTVPIKEDKKSGISFGTLDYKLDP